jgi:hypothetical protein
VVLNVCFSHTAGHAISLDVCVEEVTPIELTLERSVVLHTGAGRHLPGHEALIATGQTRKMPRTGDV